MEQKAPLFSIVTPVYKGMSFLPRCVQSLMDQTFRDFELLLVDDGSPDASGQLCDLLAENDSRIRAFHKKNGGVTSARNLGIEKATGRWLLFLDQDDKLCPPALEVIAAALSQSAPGQLVSWKHHNVWEEMCPAASAARIRRYSLPEMGLFYDTDTMHYVWTKAFDLAFVKQAGIRFDESIQDGTDDLPFVNAYCHAFFSAHPAGGVTFVETPLYYYETGNEASVSNRPQPFLESHLTMFTDLMQDMDELYGAPRSQQGGLYRRALHTLAYGVLSTPPEGRGALRQRLVRRPQVRAMLDCMKKNRIYSPFYLPYRLGSTRLIAFLFRSFETDRYWYGKADWLGYYLLGASWQRI